MRCSAATSGRCQGACLETCSILLCGRGERGEGEHFNGKGVVKRGGKEKQRCGEAGAQVPPQEQQRAAYARG